MKLAQQFGLVSLALCVSSVLSELNLVDIFKDVKPFGLVPTGVFHQETYEAETEKFKDALKYGDILIGSNSIKEKSEKLQKECYEGLVKLIGSPKGKFEENLCAKCSDEFELLKKANFTETTAEEQHKAVFDNFLFNEKVIQGITELLNEKVLLCINDLINYKDNDFFDAVSQYDILGTQAQLKLIANKEPFTSDEVRQGLIAKRDDVATFFIDKLFIYGDNVQVYDEFFTFLNGNKDCKLLKNTMQFQLIIQYQLKI